MSMDFAAKIVLDSVAPCGARLTTVELTYPRFIHSEVLTHRDRERNSASSRAIPFEAMIRRIDENPVVPIEWQQEGGGMQGRGEIPEALRPLARAIWLKAYEDAKCHAAALRAIEETAQAASIKHGALRDVTYTKTLGMLELDSLDRWCETHQDTDLKIHKTIPNRLVEPWMWITVVMTATEWANFFRLRCHPDAEVHFQKIAGMCRDAIKSSTPRPVEEGQWHLPYVENVDKEELQKTLRSRTIDLSVDEILCRISTARVARVSYLTQDGKRDWRKDLELFDTLKMGSGFGHWSPTGHVARALPAGQQRSGPFRGWHQFRKDFQGENVVGY